MKNAAQIFAGLGFLAGCLLVVAPLIFKPHSGSLKPYIAAVAVALPLVAMHRLNWRWLTLSAQRHSRGELFVLNLTLLASYATGLVYLYRDSQKFREAPWHLALSLVLWLLPLAVNALYFCLPSTARAPPHTNGC